MLFSGDVAKTSAIGILKCGHEVTIGSRSPEKLLAWTTTQPKLQLGDFAEEATFGDIIVLAVTGTAAQQVLNLIVKRQ